MATSRTPARTLPGCTSSRRTYTGTSALARPSSEPISAYACTWCGLCISVLVIEAHDRHFGRSDTEGPRTRGRSLKPFRPAGLGLDVVSTNTFHANAIFHLFSTNDIWCLLDVTKIDDFFRDGDDWPFIRGHPRDEAPCLDDRKSRGAIRRRTRLACPVPRVPPGGTWAIPRPTGARGTGRLHVRADTIQPSEMTQEIRRRTCQP